MKCLIGLDIGTSSVKGVLVSVDGQTMCASKEVFQYTTADNGVKELSTKEYLSACFRLLTYLTNAAKDNVILGVCASSASGNLLLLDKEDRPLTNIISWQDERVTGEAKELLGDLDLDAYYRSVGWAFNFKTFPLAQLCYIKKHQPELLEKCGKVCMSTEYLYYVLTGKWGLSPSAGTPFYLADQEKQEYNQEILAKLGIDASMLPPIKPCGTLLGRVKEEQEAVCGLPAGTPVVLGSFDHPSAARGVGVLEESQMLLSCGTSWVAFFPIRERERGVKNKMLIDPFLAPEGAYGTMVSITSLADRLKLYTSRFIDDSAQAFVRLSELAKKSEPGAKGLVLHLLEEPDEAHICKYAKEEIARAIMEGTVMLVKKRLDELAAKGIQVNKAVMVGGPSEDPYWTELLESICGIEVTVKQASYAGAVGAAMIAGIGVCEYKNEKDACNRFYNGER